MELVLVLPILIVLAVAVGDFGRVYASGVAVEDAAREAADYAAFDDINSSHFQPGVVPGTIDAKDSTRLEAFRRACSAVSALSDFAASAAACADPAATCPATSGGFCQLQVEDHRSVSPYADTGCQAPQSDVTCGWMVHVTVTFDFHTAINFPPMPSTVHLVRDSLYAISALPVGGAPTASPTP